MKSNNDHAVACKYFIDSPIIKTMKHFLVCWEYFSNKMPVTDICTKYSYARTAVYDILESFIDKVDNGQEPFFKEVKVGRKPISDDELMVAKIIDLRKKNLSVPEIKSLLDATDLENPISERTVAKILEVNGFAKMRKRDSETRIESNANAKIVEMISAQKSMEFIREDSTFHSENAGILIFLPLLEKYKIIDAINNSDYPGTSEISRVSSILSFIALKISNFARYSADDLWCMDRGMGLFAGLNVLPKTSWFSSYSSAVTRQMNINFLSSLNKIWHSEGLLSDTANLDFTTIPYWGDETPFENNWSGKRSKALPSIAAVLAHDPQSGIICYGDTTIKHENSDEVVMEFLDFYYQNSKTQIKYLIFDSKFTTYKHLGSLDEKNIKFITIQRRGKNIIKEINSIESSKWKSIRIQKANNKSRSILACERVATLQRYGGRDHNHQIRQIFIQRGYENKPAIIITNDFDVSIETIVRKYSLRWLIEKEISEQIDFFHLNSNSSGIVIKVDFDLTMSILTHNLYRLLATKIAGYQQSDVKTIYTQFIRNSGDVEIINDNIVVKLNKKRTLPHILECIDELGSFKYSWIDNCLIKYINSSRT
jgi:hypothetical protein